MPNRQESFSLQSICRVGTFEPLQPLIGHFSMTRDWKSGGGRPGWDAKDDIGSQTTGSLSLRRFVAVFAFAVLVGVAGWILYISLATPPTTRIVAARVSGYSTLSIKPIPFLADDTEALLNLPENLENATTIATKEIGPIDRAGSLNNPDFGVAYSEPLLMYIKGHGVTIVKDSGDLQPVLLCGNSYAPGASNGALSIEELLLRITEVQNSSTKLLVLDCNYLTSDLRLGLSINEFAEQVGQIVARSSDKDLWVLLSGADQQISITNHKRGMSRFMTAMTDGLTYIGDSDMDGKVTLSEFYNYILTEVASRAVFSSGAQPMQTPILLHAGSSSPVPVKDLPTSVIVVASAKQPKPLEDWEKPEEPEDGKEKGGDEGADGEGNASKQASPPAEAPFHHGVHAVSADESDHPRQYKITGTGCSDRTTRSRRRRRHRTTSGRWRSK